ncbi:hypothetical protein JKF63_02979 [Porcisia hertigi]|uniref:Uncharacterized protein n=1 Tax=Porcisia hertigi TaxID=2761500 RepID=A0A836I5H4_9TRYP|nr:hypothetical protein JKF63_02979 [Porcisia hertigi]
MSLSFYMPPVSTALPETSEARLMFYAEVLMANVPSLIADLGSVKYAFLSFSEKTRNEVKQKAALIQSIGRTLTSVQRASKSLVTAQRCLEEYEIKLVQAAPPIFVTSAEARHLFGESANGDTSSAEQNGCASPMTTEGNASASQGVLSTSPKNVVILNEEDIRPVREAEGAYQKQLMDYTKITDDCGTMGESLVKAQDHCRIMTEHVQDLKSRFDEIYSAWKRAERERQMIRIGREELEDRRLIMVEAFDALRNIEDECRAQELRIIEEFIARAQAEAESMDAELHTRRNRYEVELAAYQIAYKGVQGEVESLNEQCKFLRSRQADLEIFAKKQQLEEAERNCLRKVMMEALTLTPHKYSKADDRELTPAQQEQVRKDHPLVSLLGARISVLEEQRKTIGELLVRAGGARKADIISATVDRIRTLLEPEIKVCEDAL